MSAFSEHNFNHEKALIRVDFNVPVKEDTITDDTRMRAALPTIEKILKDGGSVILMSHFGRPKDGPEEKYSLKKLLPHLHTLLPGIEILFADDCIGEEAFSLSKNLKPGQVLLLENLRFHKEEKEGDRDFAEKLSELGSVYVNDAFGTAHRAHASTAVIAQYFSPDKKMFGMLMNNEVENAEKLLNHSESPFTAILGGAKVSDKIEIIENLLNKAHNIIIGGGMAYTFLKAQGKDIGNSLCEEDKLDLALELLEKAKSKNVSFQIPVDSVVADQFSNDANTKIVTNDHIGEGWMGLDIGPETVKLFSETIRKSKTILWNGPMGVFEMEKFQAGTKAVAEAIAKASQNGAYSLVGGGDSVSAINKFNLADQVSYVSTGGGALLEYFEGKELPGIKAIREKNNEK
ncbi:MAG: phosphoglycerate kinase [Ginsengibacter sp.]